MSGDALETLRDWFIRAALYTQRSSALKALVSQKTLSAFEEELPYTCRERFVAKETQHRLRQAQNSELGSLKRVGGRYLTPFCTDYPQARLSTHLLRICGTLNVSPTLAIVGSRKSSSVMLSRSRLLGELCAQARITVVSGGACGVDIETTMAVFRANGSTITALGSGLNRPSPRTHVPMFNRLLGRPNQHCVISQFGCEQPPATWTYVKRNHLIADLADAVVVMQAGARSGALYAAHRALVTNKKVYCWHLQTRDVAMQGCRALLGRGAHPVSLLVEVLLKDCRLRKQVASDLQRKILRILSEGPRTVSELTHALGYSSEKICRELVIMFSMNWLEKNVDGTWSRFGLPLSRCGTVWLVGLLHSSGREALIV